METPELVETWWTTLRVPLAVVIAALWFYVLRSRTVVSQTGIPLTDAKDARNVKAEAAASTVQADNTTVSRGEPSPNASVSKKEKKAPKKFTRSVPEQDVPAALNEPIAPAVTSPEIHVFYASQFNHTSTLAKHLLPLLPEHTRLHDISVIPNLDDYFLQHPTNAFYFLLLPSYANDSGPAQPLIEALEETLNDFRVDANPLQKLAGFAVFGTGDKEGWPLKQEFCYQAIKVEKLMERLGARRKFVIGMGDAKGRSSLTAQLEGWAKRAFLNAAPDNLSPGPTPLEIGIQEEEDNYQSDEEDTGETPLLDVEDMGPVAQRHKASSQSTDFTPKPMVSQSSTTHKALTKQGYTIVGTHSGVKICRWTKSALRGRGSCYKFSFYGIKSHLCMETTPSLACANKCVFCWRHGTNPVGTTWRWQVDPPEKIYEGALAGHYQKINMLKGMMGVKPARYEEAKRVRHCALSLVGEPIFCMILLEMG
jgi:tRNA wybutosine-synthesizing protein 1